MSWGPTFQKPRELPAQGSLPRKVVRHLVQNAKVGIGSRVLSAGCDCELSCFLSTLGMRVWGLADNPEDLVAVRNEYPDLDMKFANPQQSVPFEEQSFHLVVVRDLSAHCGPLQTPAALRATAQLLSCVRPGGTLSFVQCADADAPHGAAHRGRCYERHLAHFPGVVRRAEFSDGVLPRAPWHRLAKRPQSSGIVAVSLRLPHEPLQRSAWLRLADEFARSVATPCCTWAAELQPAYRLKKVA
jgi:hypothetical protein